MKRLRSHAAAGLAALVLLCHTSAGAAAEEPVAVGSKNFPESYVLAEMMSQLLEARGYTVERRFSLGGSLICYEALRSGEIDVYPEYTGTISEAILKLDAAPGAAQLRDLLRPHGLEPLAPFGFNNTYVLAVRRSLAEELELTRISDLARHPGLRVGITHEFRNRKDGWPGLAEFYDLPFIPFGIEHALAYQAISKNEIDVTDAYSTDGDLTRYELTLLQDDKRYFPTYLALPLVRIGLAADVKEVLATLAGRIDDERMRGLNVSLSVEQISTAQIAAEFLRAEDLIAAGPSLEDDTWVRLRRNTFRHLQLTGLALGLAGVTGVLVGILVHRSRRWSGAVLYFSGILQTIPSIALLALMIPLLGIGFWPAVAALFLYSLLPILRSTITALLTIDPLLRRVAEAMGMTRAEQVRHVLFPLALPHVLAGVKTAAIISIGTATLAAFIGAGGLGEPIVTGLTLNDTGLILQGAVPAAVLALLTEFLFELLERRLIPAHMVSSKLPD